MPIYEYRCRKCKEMFEMIQRVNEDNRGLRCPKCQTEGPERVLSAFCSVNPKSSTATKGHVHSSPGHS